MLAACGNESWFGWSTDMAVGVLSATEAGSGDDVSRLGVRVGGAGIRRKVPHAMHVYVTAWL